MALSQIAYRHCTVPIAKLVRLSGDKTFMALVAWIYLLLPLGFQWAADVLKEDLLESNDMRKK